MNRKKAKIGNYYRHKSSPNYCWARLVEILMPHYKENKTNCIIAKCEWTIEKEDKVGMIKYFRISDLLEE